MIELPVESRVTSEPAQRFGGPVVVIAMSKDPNPKVTILTLGESGRRPISVTKVPMTPGAALQTARERHALLVLQQAHLDSLSETVPRLLEPESPTSALVTTGLAGEPLIRRYHKWMHTRRLTRVAADFRAVDAWLSRLHAATAGPIEPVNMTSGACRALATRFHDWPYLEPDLAALNQLAARLRIAQTPRTVVHGDFWAGNILMVGDTVSGVVDWEYSQPRGEPLHDIARFALAYSLYLDRHTRDGRRVSGHRAIRAGQWGAGIRYAVNGVGWYPRLVHAFVHSGLDHLGAGALDVRDVLLAELATVAAEADDDAFAIDHLRLFHELTSDGGETL